MLLLVDDLVLAAALLFSSSSWRVLALDNCPVINFWNGVSARKRDVRIGRSDAHVKISIIVIWKRYLTKKRKEDSCKKTEQISDSMDAIKLHDVIEIMKKTIRLYFDQVESYWTFSKIRAISFDRGNKTMIRFFRQVEQKTCDKILSIKC